MNMIRVAIVEDEEKAAELLRKYFAKLKQEQDVDYELQVFADAVSFLEQYRGDQDLVMMDIEMPGINGMEAAKRLRYMDREVVLVFVTNMAQYAVKGYEVDALDFIVKPVSYSDFSFKMKRVLYALQMKNGSQITIQMQGGIKRVTSDEILYVEVTGHTVQYHLLQENITVRGSLSKVEEQLGESRFLRCNNCYLVNPRHIKEVKGHSVLVGTDELQISHPRRKAFMQELSRWVSNGGR